MKNKRSICIFFTILCGMFILGGCGSDKAKEKVTLKVWCSIEDKGIIENVAKDFIKENKEKADIQVVVHDEDISGVKKMVINDSADIADIYNFADDQFFDLYNCDALLDVSEYKDTIYEECGGEDTNIVKSVTRDGKLYGYPLSDSNGYFLFYNNEYFSDEDVKDLDTILEIAEKNGKYFAMDWSSGWYTYSFFGGAGKTIRMTEDGLHNYCDYSDENGDYSGTEIVNAMLNISKSKAFSSTLNDNMLADIKSGRVIAAVSGTWNAKLIEDVWGENYDAAKLPEYTLGSDKVQMASFSGYKYFGVSKKTKNKEWAMKLAKRITDYDTQMERFRKVGECPSNVKAEKTDEVNESVALAALIEQKQYSIAQNICEQYWNPMSVFGVYLASGNPDNVDLKKLLERTVNEINN